MYYVLVVDCIVSFVFVCLCWGLMTREPLCVILCRLPEKWRRQIEEIVEVMNETDRGERKMNENEITEEIKIFPLYPCPLKR